MRQNPTTSIDAYKSLNPESVREIYMKILNALKVLGSANTEKIADFLGIDHAKVHRRTKEMEGLEMIWRPGAKTLTKSGRQSFLWTIRGDNQPKIETPIAYKKEDKTSTDFANNIIKQSSFEF